MQSLDNSAKNIGHKVELNAGERVLLSSNTAYVRSPALDFDNNSDPADEKMQLDYLAEILFEFFSHKRHYDREQKKGRNILPSINERTS